MNVANAIRRAILTAMTPPVGASLVAMSERRSIREPLLCDVAGRDPGTRYAAGGGAAQRQSGRQRDAVRRRPLRAGGRRQLTGGVTGSYNPTYGSYAPVGVAALIGGLTPDDLGVELGLIESKRGAAYTLIAPCVILPLTVLAATTNAGVVGLATNSGSWRFTKIPFAYARLTSMHR